MAEITARRTGELLRGVFKILRDDPEGLPASEVLAKLEKEVPPTTFERSEYPNRPGVQRYDRIVRFSTIPCVKSGWMLKSEGRWTLTEEGRKAFDQYGDPATFRRAATEGYRKWKRARGTEESGSEKDEFAEQAPSAYGTLEEAEERAFQEIKAHIIEMDPYDFQQLVAGLVRGMGHSVDWIAPRGADGGTDAIAYSDSLGVHGPTIRVSVRRTTQAQDVDDVRSFLSQLHGDDVGLFVSAGGFTRDAEKLARQDQRKLRLINFEKLVELWKEYYDRIPEPARGLLPLKPVHFLVPGKGE